MPERSGAPRVAVVTGASRGLGLTTARHLASVGFDVAVCSRGEDESRDVAEALTAEFGVACWGSAVDVSSMFQVEEFASRVREYLGPAELIVNNAAVLGPVGTLSAERIEAWSGTLDVNLKGVANMVAAFLPQLLAARQGRIVNLSGGGVGGPRPMEKTSAYVVSKYAVVALTEILAEDFEGTNVTVNAIAPGALPTTFLAGVLDVGPSAAGAVLFEDARSRSGVLEDDHVRPFLNLLDFLIDYEARHLNGRVLSARWDRPEDLRLLGSTLSPNHFRLRRIDGDLFQESPK